MRLTPVLLFLALIASSACSTDSSCGSLRAVTAYGRSPQAQPAESLVRVRVSEGDDSRFDHNDVSWDIPVSLQGDPIVAVHLHNSSVEHNEGILYVFPDYDSGVGFVLSSNAIYDYPTPIRILFDLMRAGQTYLDIHTTAHPEGTARAELTTVDYDDWVSYACD